MDLKQIFVSLILILCGCIEVSAEYSNLTDVFGISHENIQNGKMRGWEIYDYGGINALKFSDNIPMPLIKAPTEVLIEVYTTSVNPLDQLETAGYGRTALNTLRWFNRNNEFPLILGREFCGVVRAKGTEVRSNIQIGDKVWGLVSPHQPGCHAEYVVVDQLTIVRKPDNIDDIHAAGILFAGLTAWSSIYVTGKAGGDEGAKTSKGGGSGKRICILGASGGVGSLAVQLAKAENMTITATCSTNSVEMVKELGADYVIDYRKDNLTEKFNGQSYDIILDAAGLGPDYATQLPWAFAQYITLVPPVLNDTDTYGLLFGFIKSGLTLVKNNVQTIFGGKGLLKWGFFEPAPQGIEYFTNLVTNGKVKAIIDSVYEFDSMKGAFQKVADGHLRGKVIVKVKSK